MLKLTTPLFTIPLMLSCLSPLSIQAQDTPVAQASPLIKSENRYLMSQVDELIKQNQHSEAEQLCQKNLSLLRQHLPVSNEDIRAWLITQTSTYTRHSLHELEQGHYDTALTLANQAEQVAAPALAELQQLPRGTPQRQQMIEEMNSALALAYNSQILVHSTQADNYSRQMAYNNVLDETKQVLSLTQKRELLVKQGTLEATSNSLNIVDALLLLVDVYQSRQQYTEAAPLLVQAQQRLSNTPDTPETAIIKQSKLLRLALHYYSQNTQEGFDQAQSILQQQLHSLPPGSSNIPLTLVYLGQLYQTKGQSESQANAFDQAKTDFATAENYFRESIKLSRQNSTDSIPALGLLATLYQNDLNRAADAIPLWEEAIQYLEHPASPTKGIPLALEQEARTNQTPQAHSSLALAYIQTQQYAKAKQHLQINVDNPHNLLPPTTMGSKAHSLSALAIVQRKEGQLKQALDSIEQAYAILNATLDDSEEANHEKQTYAIQYLGILREGLEKGQFTAADILPKAFIATQIAHGSQRLQAFRQVALLRAADNPAIRDKLQTLLAERHKLDNLNALSLNKLLMTGAIGATETARLTQEIQQTNATVQQLEQELRTSFPTYAQLADPQPLPLEQAQALLQPDEALLIWVQANAAGSKSTLLVVRHDRPATLHVLDVSSNVMANNVAALRAALINNKEHPTPPPFNLNLAHSVYQTLFAPALPDLGGVKHIIAVPDSAMHNLPLHLLVKDAPPETTQPTNADYANTDWLLKHYSFAYLPSVRALADLNQANSTPTKLVADTRTPFLGVGDPLFKGKALQLAARGVAMTSDSQQGNGLGFFPDTSIFKELSPLPETGTELHDIAQHLGADPKTALYLQDKASEPMVKQLSVQNKLAQARIISFATHAWLPDQQQEAGLVLTTPDHGTAEDDGYLSASEVATLKLNADWVLLSACNTGTLAGTDAQAGLSSLSKGFFMAGARSVLASLWSVNSQATAQLMPHLFDKLQGNPQVRRDEALQLTLLDMLKEPAPCHWRCRLGLDEAELLQPAHPYYWSPFVIYGEGSTLTLNVDRSLGNDHGISASHQSLPAISPAAAATP